MHHGLVAGAQVVLTQEQVAVTTFPGAQAAAFQFALQLHGGRSHFVGELLELGQVVGVAGG